MKVSISFRVLPAAFFTAMWPSVPVDAATFKIDPRMSYLWTTENDDAQLSVEVNAAHPVVDNRSPYGFDLVAAGIPVGSYVRLYTTGDVNLGNGINNPFALGGVFTSDNNGLAGSSGVEDRFSGRTARVPVPSLSERPWNTPPFIKSAGGQNKRDIESDFRIDPLPGVIVKVPARYLRHTVIDDTPREHSPGAYPSIYFGDNRDGNQDAYLQVDVVPVSHLPRYWIEPAAITVNEGVTNATIRIRRDQGTWMSGTNPQYETRLYYNFASGGTNPAEASEDFNPTGWVGVTWEVGRTHMDITIPIAANSQDTRYEGNETFNFSIHTNPSDNPNEAFIVHNDPNNANPLSILTVPVTILENDPLPTVTFADPDGAGSGTGSSITVTEGNVTQNLKVKLDRESEFAVDVYYAAHSADGTTASSPDDFTFIHPNPSNYIRIPARSPAATLHNIRIDLRDDNIHEGEELIVSHLGVISTQALYNGGRYTLRIADNDPVPNLRFVATTSSASEPSPGGSLGHPILLSLDRPSKFPVRVWYARHGDSTATSGAAGTPDVDVNFSHAEGQSNHVTIPPMETSGSIPITIQGDGVYEGTETFKIGLGTVATEAVYDRDRSDGLGLHTTTILDFDPVPSVVAAFPTTLAQSEENGSWSILVTRTARSAHPTTVALSFGGTAVAGADYSWSVSGQARPAFLTIPANSTGPASVSLDIEVLDDETLEFDETVVVTLWPPLTSGGSGHINGSATSAGVSLVITDDDDGDYAVSTPTEEAGETKPSNIGRIAVTVAGSPFPAGSTPVALWRIVGEPSWRMADDPLTTEDVEGRIAGLMCPGYHQIEFRPLEGYESPGRQVIHVTDSETVFVPAHYIDIDAGSPGSLTVQLTPAAAAASATPEADRLQWRLEGESAWRDAASQVSGLPAGSHKVVFKKVAGRAVPIPRVIKILPGSAASFTLAYVDLPANPPRRPEVLEPATTDAEPYAFCGRISSSAGYGTGTAIRERVVLTAAHVLFDDDSLTFATDVRWHHQAHRGYYQPGTASAAEYDGIENQAGILGHSSSMIPRGWVMTAGYAAQREMDVFGEYSAGIGSPESQDMDIAAAFFTDAVAGDAVNPEVARGGHAGMYYREAAMPQGNFFIGTQKLLIGYPVEGYSDDDRGRMHASDPADSATINLLHSHGNVFTSSTLAGAGGISGGPLMVRGTDSEPWRVAAIFLGGVGQGIYYQLHEELFQESTGPGVGDGVIAMADKKSNAGDEGSGDGSTTVTQSTTQSSSDVSAAIAPYTNSHIRFACNHPAGRWARKPARISQTPQYAGIESLLTMPSGSTERIVFKPLAGWITPAEVTLALPGLPGAVGEHEFRYIPTYYSSLQSLIAALHPSATPDQTGPDGDVDGDGVSNLLEWAFNMDPLTPDRQELVPGSGRSGLPVVSLVGGGSLRRLKIEYVKLRNGGPVYAVEFSSGGAWTNGGNLIATSPIDANWERVVVEDSEVGLPRRFVRVKLTQAP